MIANGGNTFAFFTRNPRGGNAKAIDETDVKKFLSLAGDNGFGKIVAHAPYTMNCCAAKENLREFARNTMADDLKRMEYTPGNYYNFLLETMAGKGSEVGRDFQELRRILDLVEKDHKMGICLDTCHVWDGGYDIVNDLDGVLTEFDQVIGLERLKAVHLNDSMNGLGSHKDRHAKIGEGQIGLEALVRVIRHPALKEIPFILETPNDDEGWTREIALLREEYEK